MQVLQWALFGYIVVRMVLAGFWGRPRLFTWPMFSRVSACLISLTDQHGKAIDPWEHIVNQDPGMNLWEFNCFLSYLREVKGIQAEGTVTLIDYTGERVHVVRDGHVVG